MMEAVLTVHRLHKKIKGRTIIEEVSFDVREGEIFGFLGPNGSGKTTTIRMLVGLVKPTSGEVRISGHDVAKHPEQALRHVGCIVENPEVYTYLTGWDNLAFSARMLDDVAEERIREVARIVQLDDRIQHKVKTYSLGMRQRLGIAQALLGRPKLLILDEPTNGLDPKGIKELREFVRRLAAGGLSVLISSHLLSEIQLLCDRVAIISEGRVIAEGSVEELVEKAGSYVLWQLDRPDVGRELLEASGQVKFVTEVEHRLDEAVLASLPGAIVTSMPKELVAPMIDLLVQQNVGVRAALPIAPTLEELFLGMTEGERHA
ncbi:ABC transporter ATP-binding protein [Paenibacillus harenae]|uniref:ABC transporter ATP-binding protein n=1 Tax=Paenibacillus harenae TaxID=306543 RepID=UPI00279345D2|nr:ABC transporter ATP-binding protein [Paenibacillus harenae]MDQ0058108.1 ABC-2 type transport system ATP-binding protein [Paenibacillus harenae]